MLRAFLSVIAILAIASCNQFSTKDQELLIQMLAERAYFEGQRDAINGDIRIKVDSPYSWLKSPWVDGRTPVYRVDTLKSNPTHLYY